MATAAPTTLPPPGEYQAYVEVSALEAGHLTLPERLFVTDADPEKKSTVPSMSFLIQHPGRPGGGKDAEPQKLIFDLGLKRDLSAYPPAQHAHISQRHPCGAHPDVADSLRAGGLDAARDITMVILSHVHWDHVGTPSDFESARFVVGSGTLHLLDNGAPPHYPANTFDPKLLPRDRTWELPPSAASNPDTAAPKDRQTHHHWEPIGPFPQAIDLFADGSVYIIDSPGHLFGHVNLLARVGPGRWVYLGGDCCHDVRILKGEKGIAMYDDGHGGLRSVHVDTDIARGTIGRIGKLLAIDGVEVIVAHDGVWREKNPERFLPGKL